MARQRQTVGIRTFDAALNEFEMTPRELSLALGYSKTAGSYWQKAGSLPKVAQLAIECLQRRRGRGANAHSLYVLRIPQKSEEAALKVIEALSCHVTKIHLDPEA